MGDPIDLIQLFDFRIHGTSVTEKHCRQHTTFFFAKLADQHFFPVFPQAPDPFPPLFLLAPVLQNFVYPYGCMDLLSPVIGSLIEISRISRPVKIAQFSCHLHFISTEDLIFCLFFTVCFSV